MGRFSVSPRGHCLASHDDTPWREDDDTSTSSDETDASVESSSSDEDDYPHPLGFSSYGKTRFFLDPPKETVQEVRIRLGFLQNNKYDWLEQEDCWEEDAIQSFPPLSQYTDAKTAPTEALLAYSDFNERPEQDDSVDNVIQLLRAASLVDSKDTGALKLKLGSQKAGQRLWALCRASEQERHAIRSQMDSERLRLDKEHRDAAESLRMLLKRDQRAAEKVLKQQEAETKAQQEAERLQREQEEKVQEERQRVADERLKKQQEEERKVREEEEKRKEEKAKKTEYVTKAKKLVAKLVDLRASVEPFEKSKNVSRRRLQMKKAVKRNLNTLNQDAQKIQTVANELSNTIQQAREEDEQLKQQLQGGNTQITSEMTRGKRYLVDLLASDAMVRAQAEGFNGTRGDGFPLASTLAMVSTQAKELVPILAAHIYTVCPTAIPTLPKVSKGESEEELMESLGMSKGKDGQYESFERFLTRTEGIVSLVADIMASNPGDHVLLGGHKGAKEWLERFLDLLPPAPEPLPLLTAPVLDAFLTGAGHMLAHKYPEEFRNCLDVIMNDTVNRLDEGPIGAPSALRLKKVVQNGFDSFLNTLPSKAIPSLYNAPATAAGDATSSVGLSGSLAPATAGPTSKAADSNPFGGSATPFGTTSASSASNVPANPFGAPASSGAASFGGVATGSLGTVSPFSTSAGQAPQTSSGFGNGGGDAMNASPFTQTGSSVDRSPFGQPASQSPTQSTFATSPFQSSGGNAVSASPFTQSTSSVNPSPFGPPASQPFPSNQSSQSAFGTSPFSGSGSNTMNASPFTQPSSNPNPSPFGPPASQGAPPNPPSQSAFGVSTGPFGSSSGTTMNASPFTQSISTVNPSPFGAPATQSGPSMQPPQSTFGTSPFTSAGGSTMNPSPFTQSSSAMNPSPFGQPGGQTGTSAFGSGSSPFGAPSGQSSTAFGVSATTSSPFTASSTTPFGPGGSQQQSGSTFGNQGGGGRGKPPCKFFAQGRCRYGDNCRFSHENPGTPAGGNTSFGGNTPFGGGGATNNPFGGGAGSNPFGGPRR